MDSSCVCAFVRLYRPHWFLTNTESERGGGEGGETKLHQTSDLSENTARTYLRTYVHITDAASCTRARERTVWVGSCICGRGGGAYPCRVFIVNWFRNVRWRSFIRRSVSPHRKSHRKQSSRNYKNMEKKNTSRSGRFVIENKCYERMLRLHAKFDVINIFFSLFLF